MFMAMCLTKAMFEDRRGLRGRRCREPSAGGSRCPNGRAHGGSERLGVEEGGREIVAALDACLSGLLDAALDYGDGREMVEAGLVGIASVGQEPGDLMAGAVRCSLMRPWSPSTVTWLSRAISGGRIGEEGCDVGMGGRPVALKSIIKSFRKNRAIDPNRRCGSNTALVHVSCAVIRTGTRRETRDHKHETRHEGRVHVRQGRETSFVWRQ